MADSLVAGWLAEIGLEAVIPTFREVYSNYACNLPTPCLLHALRNQACSLLKNADAVLTTENVRRRELTVRLWPLWMMPNSKSLVLSAWVTVPRCFCFRPLPV